MSNETAITSMIAARGAEIVRRQELGGFDDTEATARLDELAVVSEYVVTLLRADVTRTV